MRLNKYTLEELQEAVKSSISIRQSLSKLKIKAAGGNYQTFKKAIKFFNIDTSHFKGQAHNKDFKRGFKRPISDYLSNKYPILSHKLKLRLIKENILQSICSNCQLSIWFNSPIPLELDHIDGNHFNNNLENLRLLCPNCHALTSNYRGKNISPKT